MKTKVKPLFAGRRRESAIRQVMNKLRDWRLSKFEHEGSTRASVRSGLCLKGYGWEVADMAAADLVSVALTRLGAKRPTWLEGQPEFTDSGRDQDAREAMLARSIECARCGSIFAPLNNRPAKYCSAECATPTIHLPRSCEQCCAVFKPKIGKMRYCSHECARLASRTVAERQCRQCKAIFRPKNGNRDDEGFYCSMACTVAARAFVRVVRECEWCFTVYEARGHKSRFCCRRCNQKTIDLRNGKWRPKEISSPLLDYLFRQQGLRITAERIAA